MPLRTLQRALAPHRQARRAAELATVRFETPPGYQLQIDFGEKWIEIGGARTKVYVFVAVLGYSRRIFVRASLSQPRDRVAATRHAAGSTVTERVAAPCQAWIARWAPSASPAWHERAQPMARATHLPGTSRTSSLPSC